MDVAHTIMARVAGAALLAFGLGLAALAVWMVERRLSLSGGLEPGVAAVIAVFAALALFCLLAGYRLLFDRPNRYGSLLSPLGWRVLATFFFALALAFMVGAFWLGTFKLALACFFSACLAYTCVVAARSVLPPLSPEIRPTTVPHRSSGSEPGETAAR
jgi:hypothetical protein